MKKFYCFMITLLVLLLVNPANSYADPLLQYDYIDLGYRYTDPDPGDELNGGYGHGSYSIFSNVFLDIGYAYDTSNDVDINTLQYGGGFFFPLMDKLHLVGNVGGKRVRIEFNDFGSGNTDRFYVGPELRAKIHQNMEVNFGYTWEAGEGDATNNYNLGVMFAVNDSIAIPLAVDFLDEEAQQFSAGMRFSF